MYPDVQDVSQSMHRLTGVVRPGAEDIWPVVVLVRAFLTSAYQWCRNSGRHKYVPASELLQLTESFVGKQVTPYELCLSFFMALPTGCCAARVPYSLPINITEFDEMKVKFPPLHDIEDMRTQWQEQLLIHEREIAKEREVVTQRQQFFKRRAH